MSRSRILFLLLLLGAVACGGSEEPAPAPAPVQAPEPPAPPSAEAKQAFFRGIELYQAEQPVEALAEMRRAAELAPQWDEANLRLGKLLLSLAFVKFGTATKEHSMLDQAIVHLERAVALLPGKADPLYWSARAHAAAGRSEEAGERFRKVLALDPAHKLAVKEYALLLESLGEVEAARVQFERACVLMPLDEEVRFHLGLMLEQLDDLEGAVEAHLAALALNPAHPGPRPRLVTLYHRLGDPDAAEHQAAEHERFKPLRQRLSQAMAEAAARPRDVAALLAVAEAYLEIGMPLAARTWVARALGVAPDDARAQELERRLDAANPTTEK